jgi:hypothetical protein
LNAGLVVLFVMVSTVGSARGDTEVLAYTGEAAADGNGVYSTFTDPVLNHFGNLAFRADLAGTALGTQDDRGLFRVGSSGPTVICRENWVMPDLNGRVYSLSTPAMNNASQVVFRADATDTLLGFYDAVGIYLSSGGGPPTQLVRGNDPAPDGNGRFLVMSETPLIDDDVITTFWASFTGTAGGYNDDTAIIVEGWGATRIYARENQLVPGGDGRFSGFRHITENEDQAVGFLGDMRNTSGGSDNNTAIFRANLAGLGATLTELAREGDPPPDGNGQYYSFYPSPSVDRVGNGRIAFHAWLENTSGGVTDDSGIFMATNSGVYRIAREGDAPPGGNGTYSNFDSDIAQNDSWVVFRAFMRDTSGGSLDEEGLYRGNGLLTYEVARRGNPAPDGNGVFRWFPSMAINKAGVIAFAATLTGTTGGSADNAGLFLGNGFDTVEVARKGDPLLGSTIVELHMATGPDCRNGLNNLAQVAYRALLADGREALVLHTPEVNWKGGYGFWDTKDNWVLQILPDRYYDIVIEPAGNAGVSGPRSDTMVKSLRVGATNVGIASLDLTGGGDLSVENGVAIGPMGRILVGAGRSLAAIALRNEGQLAFESGEAHVRGGITNGPGGQILVPRGADVWLHGHVQNEGALNVDPTGVVHVGGLTGNGCAGGGMACLLGDVEPGVGVGPMVFDGDVSFGPDAVTHVELGGLVPGRDHDQLQIAGALALSGRLEVTLVRPFELEVGQYFEIIDVAGPVTGQFRGLAEGARVPFFDTLPLHVTYLGGDGNDVGLYAVSEPATAALLALGALGLLRRRRRRPCR